MRRHLARSIIIVAAVAAFASAAWAATVEQIISREDPTFICREAAMSVGRDGMVYLASGGNNGHFIRIAPDGTNKMGGAPAAEALQNCTANADGVIGTSHGHFAHQVALYDKSFKHTGAVTDFLVSDNAGWDAPSQVDVGASGDFYGLDQHRDRILRISPTAKVVKEYAIPHEPEGNGGIIDSFRVCEKTQSLYILARDNTLRCIGFDGAKRWQMKVGNIHGYQWGGAAGGMDVDDNGVLYAIDAYSDTVKKFGADGQPAGEIKLQMGDLKPVDNVIRISDMRVFRNLIVVKRQHPTEMFQSYDITGALKNAVSIDHERLKMEFPGDVWTAGQPIDFKITFDAGGRQVKPTWRVWARTFAGIDWRELKIADGKLQVPADLAGIYQVKVTQEVQPDNAAASEYKVQALVEIRQPGTKGSACAFTENNRLWFGRGEAIPFFVLAKTDKPVDVAVTVLDGKTVLATGKAAVQPGAKAMQFALPKSFTAGLKPGEYTIAVAAPGLTCVPQKLQIGPGMTPRSFLTVDYGDYGATYPWPGGNVWEAPDAVAKHVERSAKLGFDFCVDRLGVSDELVAMFSIGQKDQIDPVTKRLTDDPAAVAPEKTQTATQFLQVMAAYSAKGIQEMGILLYMDAGLPLGNPFDTRKPEQMLADLDKATKTLAPFASFKGWVWASNWWVVGKRTPEEETAWKNAMKNAKENGVWDKVIEDQMNARLQMAVDASAMFEKKMEESAGGRKLITATACPYRAVESYPPLTLSNVDEVDLQGQFEQIAVPYFPMHSVDFYRRPGKLSWGHPEVWNDSGTGDMILPTLFAMVMRGCNAVGFSGNTVNWPQAEDPRQSESGAASVYRSLNTLLHQYGPWFATMQGNDRVVILASARMLKMDEWSGVMGRHFGRLLGAYVSCMHAHQPATFAFPEDTKPGDLNKYKAILIIDQKVELEPALLDAVKAAKAAGSAVFYDGTCREESVKDLGTPLGVSFDKIEDDPSQAGDDAAYWRFRDYALAGVPAIHKALDPVVKPVAVTDNPEVLMSERVAEDGRYLFVVNNTNTTFDPGQLWRVTLGLTSKVPVVAPIRLDGSPKVVYDVFAGKKADVKDGVVQADLRSLPMRVFAVLPAEIDELSLGAGPKSVKAGETIGWIAEVLAKGKRIQTTIPVRMRLVNAEDRTILAEQYWAASPKAGEGSFVAPATASKQVLVEAKELITGKTASLAITVEPGAPLRLDAAPVAADSGRSIMFSVEAIGKPDATWAGVDTGFGPHVRDMIISADGDTALVVTNNWDHNLYAVDVASGKVQWRQKLGHYFAFCPQPLKKGFAVQGFDMLSAEGYHLYLLDGSGKASRRFALYGVPKRLPHRFVPSILNDRINNFAASPDGSWVASAGDLGLAVWSSAGKLRWSQDWWKTQRHTAVLAAPDAKTLVAVEGLTATAFSAANGKQLWQVKDMAATGEVKRAKVSRDGKTIVLQGTTEGGRAFILRDGKLARAIPTAIEDFDVSADGGLVAVVTANQLKLYSVANGLQWMLPGDEMMRSPRISPDGTKVAAGTDLGTAYVVDQAGKIIVTQDMGTKPVPAWLPNGDLLLGTWMGKTVRLNAKTQFAAKWTTLLKPEATDMRGKLLADDGVPTTRIAAWSNAEPQPMPITPNLLTQTKPIMRFVPMAGWGGWAEFTQEQALFFDGKPDPPKDPWLLWARVGFFAETSPFNYVLIDAFRTQMHVEAITLFEDPAHPESWLRDAKLEYWDASKELWVPGMDLLSNAAVHTHKLARPIDAARFRLVMPYGLCGNLRLGEAVFHGKTMGCSHPDVQARRPVAVLFDDGIDLERYLMHDQNGLAFDLKEAFAGNRSMVLKPRDGKPAQAAPLYMGGAFGHSLPNWDLEIAENPQPGQYRWLEFAWKAGGPEAKSIGLKLSCAAGETVAVHAGAAPAEGGNARKVADAPPTQWTKVRVDLWDAFKKPVRVQGMTLSCDGSAAWFDQIVLTRAQDGTN